MRHAVHMTRHNMPTQFVAHPQRPLKINTTAKAPGRNASFRDSFGAYFDVKTGLTQRNHR